MTKQKKKIRLIQKQIKKYTYKRCKYSIEFDNNIKFYKHIRICHVKKSKSKFVQQFFEHVILFFISFVSSFRSIIFLFFLSSNFLFFAIFYIKNCTRTFKKRIIEINNRIINYFFKVFIKIFVDCNIKQIEILNKNNFTICYVEIFSFFDCDIQIDIQIYKKINNHLFVCFVYFVSNIYIIEILFYYERFDSHVR